MILGLDVHANYGRIDWNRVAAAGVRFVIAKCTEGNNDNPDTVWNEGKDARFNEYIAGAKAAGLYVGAYLFAYPLPSGPNRPPGRSPVEQARKFYADSKALGTRYGELPPALDLEWPPVRKQDKDTGRWEESWERWEIDPQFISEWGRECAEELTRLYGRKPLLYTYKWYVDTLRKGISYSADNRHYNYRGTDVSWMADYPLWIPSANALQDWMPVGKQPLVPKPWSDWTVWQFGFDGSNVRVQGVPACPIDRNVFNGDLAALRELAQVTSAETEPELPGPDDDTQPVRVPTMRPEPFGTRIIHPTIDFPARRYPDGPGNDDDPEAA
jgi:lysozyme